MKVSQLSQDGHWIEDLSSFAVGAAGGLAVGLLLSRAAPRSGSIGREIREQVRSVARRLRPARLHRLATEQAELDRLENTVLDRFLEDEVLGERGVDIGAISLGIIELSGSVETEDEAVRAVSLASRISGVRTVVNRLEVEDLIRNQRQRDLDGDDPRSTSFFQQDGRVGGMGRRRQSLDTDPDRPDDSQQRKERALAAADRDQWEDEDLARSPPGMGARPDLQAEVRKRFAEDELDNQDPGGGRAGGDTESGNRQGPELSDGSSGDRSPAREQPPG